MNTLFFFHLIYSSWYQGKHDPALSFPSLSSAMYAIIIGLSRHCRHHPPLSCIVLLEEVKVRYASTSATQTKWLCDQPIIHASSYADLYAPNLQHVSSTHCLPISKSLSDTFVYIVDLFSLHFRPHFIIPTYFGVGHVLPLTVLGFLFSLRRSTCCS